VNQGEGDRLTIQPLQVMRPRKPMSESDMPRCISDGSHYRGPNWRVTAAEWK
jgi:hypothetical protein